MAATPVLAEEVAAALRDGGPVVALETTLVSHGFPRRQGLDVALAAEARVRAAGAVPATIGVVDGAVRAGLTEPELGRFAAAGGSARQAGPGDPPVAAVVSAAVEAGGIAAPHWQLNDPPGPLLARPPDPSVDLEEIITEAVSRVRQQGVTGQSVTPAVLSLVHELSGGRSVAV